MGNHSRRDLLYRIATLPEDQTDGVFRGPRVLWSIHNELGDDDSINGGGGERIQSSAALVLTRFTPERGTTGWLATTPALTTNR